MLKIWKYRYITVFGKICVIKNLILPNMMNIAAIFPDITKKRIEDIEILFWKFMGQIRYQ